MKKCQHSIPLFQSCPLCKREMVHSPITSQFLNSLTPIGLKFPKSIPKKKKTMYDYAEKQYAKNIEVTKDGHLRVKRAKKRILKGVGAKKKVKRTKLPSIKQIKKKAWDLFSIFIRARDKKCVLCGSVKGLSAGHLIPVGKAPTRYDENNVFGLCSTCNFRDRFERGYHDLYVAWYIEKYGAKQYIRLVSKSTEFKQRKRIDYLEIIKRYELPSK